MFNSSLWAYLQTSFKILYMSTYFFVYILYYSYMICFTEDHKVDWLL